jgi:hypothetical protein
MGRCNDFAAMRIYRPILLFITLILGNQVHALDVAWQATLPTSGITGEQIGYGVDGSAAIITSSSETIYWYSSNGALQSTISVTSEVGLPGDYGYDFLLVSNDYIFVYDENWASPDQSRLIIFSLSNNELSSEVILGSTPEDNLNLPSSNFIPVVKGTTLTMYRIPNLSGGSPSSSLSMVPNNSVVIPSSYQGNVEIMLETSNDLVEWTQALPGTYNPATSPRFFRVRAESAE